MLVVVFAIAMMWQLVAEHRCPVSRRAIQMLIVLTETCVQQIAVYLVGVPVFQKTVTIVMPVHLIAVMPPQEHV